MDDKNFEVGQVWADGLGHHMTITGIEPSALFPVMAQEIDNPSVTCTYKRDGSYLDGMDSPRDLINLLTEAPGKHDPKTQPATALQFEVGQVWLNRDGVKVEIRSLGRGGERWPIIGIRKNGDDPEAEIADTFQIDGQYVGDSESVLDLVKLVKNADGMPAEQPQAASEVLPPFDSQQAERGTAYSVENGKVVCVNVSDAGSGDAQADDSLHFSDEYLKSPGLIRGLDVQDGKVLGMALSGLDKPVPFSGCDSPQATHGSTVIDPERTAFIERIILALFSQAIRGDETAELVREAVKLRDELVKRES